MNNYDDIINMPHHVSKHHPQMSMYQRAAQFAPFAALTGHDQAIADMAKKHYESFEKSSKTEDEDNFEENTYEQ
ncbi:MAG: hypothetical protein MJZ13_05160 [Bacteroidales bacterium]|nr:hypothetical protein [Bacteroidales bacterium]